MAMGQNRTSRAPTNHSEGLGVLPPMKAKKMQRMRAERLPITYRIMKAVVIESFLPQG